MAASVNTRDLPRDLREGGVWSRKQRFKNDVLYGVARTCLFIASYFSRRTLRSFGSRLGSFARFVVPKERKRAEANIARTFPDLDATEQRALLVRCYRELGSELGDVVATLLDKPESKDHRLTVDAAGKALLRALHGEGRGIVLASAHLGNWERVGAALAAIPLPVTAVVREAYDPRFDGWLETVRHRAGMKAIARGAKGAAFRLVRTLRENGVLAIPMDLRSRVASVRVPFMDRPADTAVGPARLALRTGAAVVVATLAERFVTVTHVPTHDLAPDEEGERELTTRINRELSARILARPSSWPWMHPRWETVPDFERAPREKDKL